MTTKFKKTPFDSISAKVAPVLRNLHDLYVNKISGSKTSLLRITSSRQDLLGDETYSLNSYLIANTIIEYPFSDIEIFTQKDQQSTSKVEALSIWDMLPIKIYIPHSESTYQTEASNLDENDLLLDILYDSAGNKIPIYLQSPVTRGTFMGKQLAQKCYFANLFRGNLETPIQNIVDNYITYLGIPSFLTTIPADEASGVARDSNIVIQFTVPMNSGSVENYLSISPSLPHTKSYDVSGIVLTINPTNNMSGLTLYTVTTSASIQSKLYLEAEDVQSFYFTTRSGLV